MNKIIMYPVPIGTFILEGVEKNVYPQQHLLDAIRKHYNPRLEFTDEEYNDHTPEIIRDIWNDSSDKGRYYYVFIEKYDEFIKFLSICTYQKINSGGKFGVEILHKKMWFVE